MAAQGLHAAYDLANAASLGLDGTETFDIPIDDTLQARQEVEVTATKADGTQVRFTTRCRIDTPVEVEYYRHGGILHYVLRDFLSDETVATADERR